MSKRPTGTRSRRARAAEPARAIRELSWIAFDEMAREVAERAKRAFDPETVVGVVKGGVFAGAAVAEALGRPFFAVRISRRSRDHGILRRPVVHGRMPRDVRGRRVLVVDDVAASGETLKLARKLARGAGATKVKTASIAVRKLGFRPDWFAVSTDELVVFPWDYQDLVEDRRFDPKLAL